MIYNILKKTGETFQVGDYYLTHYHKKPVLIKNIVGAYLNNNNHKDGCAKCPFNFDPAVALTTEQLDILKSIYDATSLQEQKSNKEIIEFIIAYKIIDHSLYHFYSKLKNIEFIPKTFVHIKTLYNALHT